MAADPISVWLAGLFTELAKEAAKGGAQQFARWLDGTRGEEARAMSVALALALDDFKRYGDQARAGQLCAFLSERQVANDTAFGDAMLRALLTKPSGVIALSPDLQSRVPVDLHPAALEFLSHFHRRLWSQPPFDRLLQAKDAQDDLRIALRSLEALERISPHPDYATEEQRYLAQLIANTELLEFVGIPDPRQNAAIKLEDIFVPLGAEVEIAIERELETAKERLKPEAYMRIAKAVEKESRMTTRRVSLDDALRTHTHLMILGDPGAGKSTLLRYLTLVAARAMMGDAVEAINEGVLQEPRLPVMIALRDFAASRSDSLVDFFYTNAKRLQVELSRGFFERALDDGRCIVCLDGLDEVVVSDQRIAVRNAVAAFANRYGYNNRIIVTSRIVGYENAPLDSRAFAHHTILPFTEKEIESFVHRWYKARERVPEQAQEQAEQLCKTIKDSDRLRNLAENPLMLTIIALVHRIEAELPNERVKLYDKCTESLLWTWEDVKGLAHDHERTYSKHRQRLLEKLAFWMHTQSQEAERQAEVKRGDLKAQLIAFLLEDPKLNLSADLAELEADAFIELAKSRTGILVERGDGIYSFVHLTFQEYFAACDLEKRYITDLERLWREIQPHLYDSRWREVILLLLGRLNEHDEPPSIIVGKVLRERDKFDEVLHRNLFLAARCLTDRVNVKESLGTEIIRQLAKLGSARRPRWNPLQRDAIEALGTIKDDERVYNSLLMIAQDKKTNSLVRIQAAERLSKCGGQQIAESILLKLVKSEAYAPLRWEAAEALGRVGLVNQATDLLLGFAKDKQENPFLRRSAVVAFERLGIKDSNVVSSLIALSQDKAVGTDVRLVAARQLGELGKQDIAIPILLELARDRDLDDRMRQEAAESLGDLGQTDIAIPLLTSLAEDRDVDSVARSVSAEAISRFGQKDEAVRILLSMTQQPVNQSVDQLGLSTATLALGKLGQLDFAKRALLFLSLEPEIEDHVRVHAAQGLAELGEPHLALNQLMRLVPDSSVDSLARMGAIDTLGEFSQGNKKVQRLLLGLSKDKDQGVRNAAYNALKQVVGNMRYAELNNGQKRIKRTGKKSQESKSKKTKLKSTKQKS